METELRRSPRVPFVASAEVTQIDTEVRLLARTSDLSSHGCYLDMVNPLPAGSVIRIAIAHGNRTFDSTGSVIYSQSPLGMGVEFREVPPDHRLLLEQWVNDPKRLLA